MDALPVSEVDVLPSKRPVVDRICAEASDLARNALDGLADPATVGEHLGVESDGERVVTHLFESLLAGYRGWRWAVTIARPARGRTPTVDEAMLLPGPTALSPPAWVPWTERLRPGDLSVGDLLPTEADDDRLEPGWNATALADPVEDPSAEANDEALEFAAIIGELDLARPRVLSPLGVDDAVDRWLSGDHGPESAMAQAAPATCSSCGFRLPVRGPVGQAFGICANALSPSDGHVVALNYGCGAHSEAVVVPAMVGAGVPVVDEVGYDLVDDAPAADSEAGTVRDDDPSEELGHG